MGGRGVSCPYLVGRSGELELLLSAFAEIAGGTGPRLVLIGGEAGVGKTRLLTEMRAAVVGGGGTPLIGGCIEVGEGGLPYAPLVEAFRAHFRTLSPVELERLIGSARADLGVLLPELDRGSLAPVAAITPSARARLFEHLLGVVSRIASGSPLVLVIEDLHWADRSTRDVLFFLLRNLDEQRVLFVGTFRSDELHRQHPLRGFLAEVDRDRRVERLELAPLSHSELEAQISGILGEPPSRELADSIWRRAEGNPFYAEELLAAGDVGAALPLTLREILLTRVEAVSEDAQQLLRVLAAGGRRVSEALLAAVVTLSDPEREQALREAVRQQILVADAAAETYAFRHALLWEAVYSELLPGERGRLHAAFGEALDRHPELVGQVGGTTSDLARHWYAAHDIGRALKASIEAGLTAERSYGFAEAGEQYGRALDLWDQAPDSEERLAFDRISLVRRAAEVANLAGEHRRAAALIRGVLAEDRPEDETLAGLLHERLGRYLWAAGDSEAALAAYEEAVRLVPVGPGPARARVLAAHGQALMLTARYREARSRCEEAITIARAARARAEEGHALNTLGLSLAHLGEPELGVDHVCQARKIAETTGDLDDLARAYLNHSELLAGPPNRLEEAVDVALRGFAVCERVGLASDYGVSLLANAASAQFALGRWVEAGQLVEQAGRLHPHELAAIDLHLARARLLVAQGRDEAGHTISVLRGMLCATIDPQYNAPVRVTEAELALWSGDAEAARNAVAAGLDHLEGTDDAWFAGPLLSLGARAEADRAQHARDRHDLASAAAAGANAARLCERAFAVRDAPGRTSPPRTAAHIALCEAEAGRARGDPDPELWRVASNSWDALGQPYPAAYARWRHAEALLGRNARSADAKPTLRAAHATARSLSAGPLLKAIEGLATRARIDLADRDEVPAVSASPQPLHKRLGLTPREFEVLSLVAAGRTNRQIGKALFITEKTASVHVSHILAKLGATSRVEAAAVALRLRRETSPPRNVSAS